MLIFGFCGMRLSDLDHAGGMKSGVRRLGPQCDFCCSTNATWFGDHGRHLR